MKFDEINQAECKKQTEEMLKTAGNNLKKLRETHNLSQSDVAFFTFSDKSSISSLERGITKNTTLLTLVRLSELFNINLNELLND